MGNAPSSGNPELGKHAGKGGNNARNEKGDKSYAVVELEEMSKVGEYSSSENSADENEIKQMKEKYPVTVSKGGNKKGLGSLEYRILDSPTVEIHSNIGTSGETTPPVIIELVTSGE